MRLRTERGFTLMEVIVAVAIIVVLAAIAIPSWMNYWPVATVRGGARDVQQALNRARMLAISTRQNICVEVIAAGYRYRQGTCAGLAWVGTGTNATGLFDSPEYISLTRTVNPIFTQFGTASQTGTLTVNGPSNRTLTVTVLPSGQSTIP